MKGRKFVLEALKECSKSRDLERGRQLHATAVENGDFCETYIANTVLNMYCKCGSMVDAVKAFQKIRRRDRVSWNVLILGYAENGEPQIALDLFCRKISAVDALVCVSAVKACSVLASKEEGRQNFVKIQSLTKGLAVDAHVSRSCFIADARVRNTLIDMYSKCGSMENALRVFNLEKHCDVISWNALIFGYVDYGDGDLALELFSRMEREGCPPDELTLIAAVKACGVLAVKENEKLFSEKLLKVRSLKKGMAVHSRILRNAWLDSDTRLASTLIDMYVKCGSMSNARRVFDGMQRRTMVSWTALLLGYADNGEGEVALELYSRMGSEVRSPDAVTFVAALKACSSVASTEEGTIINGVLVKTRGRERGFEIHSQAVSSGFGKDWRVLNSSIDMFSKCGCMVEAQEVFDGMERRTRVSWNALIFGYAENGEGETALELLIRMKREGWTPDSLTFVASLKACSVIGALQVGRELHQEICSRGFSNDMVLITSLMDFYAKCGSMVEAQRAFDSLSKRSVITWHALMTGYARHGDAERVFDLFRKMTEERVQPNGSTFRCILNACSHAGLVGKGKEYFESMKSKYGITPDLEHYTCMVDILGRANKLEEAVDLVNGMPFVPNALIWTMLIRACEVWKNIEVGRIAFKAWLSLEEKDVGSTCVTMCNIYRSEAVWKS